MPASADYDFCDVKQGGSTENIVTLIHSVHSRYKFVNSSTFSTIWIIQNNHMANFEKGFGFALQGLYDAEIEADPPFT